MNHPSSPPEPAAGLRASDADREGVAAALRRHHLDGRLDTDELQDRLGRCYAAQTGGDLAALLADLPRDEPAPPRRGAAGWPSAAVAAGVLVLIVALAAVTAGTDGHAGPLPFLAVFLLLRLARGPRRRRTAWSPRV
jgi:hypothetical protein